MLPWTLIHPPPLCQVLAHLHWSSLVVMRLLLGILHHILKNMPGNLVHVGICCWITPCACMFTALLKSSFHLCVERIAKLFFLFAPHCDWSGNLAPPSQQSKCRTETNYELSTCIFSFFRQFAWFWFGYLLASLYFSLLWLLVVITWFCSLSIQ